MRITKISVKGLFGMFDHEIPLNQESRITIVHGPNGVGKSVLMRMVHGLFHGDFEVLGATPFEEFRVDFDNGAFMTIEKLELSNKLSMSYDDGTETDYERFVPVVLDTDSLIDTIKKHIPYLYLVMKGDEPYWMFQSDWEDYDWENSDSLLDIRPLDRREFFYWYYSLEPIDRDDLALPFSEMPDWFRRIGLLVRLIETQRQLDHHTWFTGYLIQDYARRTLADAVWLPNPEPTAATRSKIFRSRLKRLNIELSRGIDSSDKYHERTLERYTDMRNQYQLFQDIISERFLFKSLAVRGSELVFTTDDGTLVPMAALSSGEQHLLNICFELLFETLPDTLVMIDEPELSMNVVWQRNFIKDLQRIIELRKFDVLVATHSPEVIYDKWDWTVALGEKAND